MSWLTQRLSILLCLALVTALARAQGPDYHLAPRAVAPDVWVLEGANADFSAGNGCNIINTGFIDTGDGVLVINTGPSKLYGEQQRAAIRTVTSAPVRWVFNLNLHPDYFFGNQAYADVGAQALPGTIAGAQREGEAYADNLYRICGEWMQNTVSTPATQPLTPGTRTLGRHHIELIRFDGHTDDDLVLVDRTSGVVFAGGLAFRDRIPTAPHANIEHWLASLDRLQKIVADSGARVLIPSHGPALGKADAIAQTRQYLLWLDARMRHAAEEGRDLAEVIAMPVDAPYAQWGGMPAEYLRNVTRFYPRYESAALVR
ncbi:quinoprotein relay system zinc metallohydrolase 1 [Ralstonia soli]|uniref:Quinoprotein relay system zinc metallohydrolase 1 n=1 Tax=Ralstonia soli TaxID=2953896 RepID=A0ABT1ATF9_9RALS|nr:quinoprotein relay system zinc metallohydrolase 1 [Ralstonia soli]MCO5401736.1 quinoprotein relay system zinc metallohydrolase 1 [Ralstonia soli]